MENENLIEEQPAPVIEKVSLQEIEKEQHKLSPEEQQLADKLAKSVLNMNEQELKKAIAFVKKKIEILKNMK